MQILEFGLMGRVRVVPRVQTWLLYRSTVSPVARWAACTLRAGFAASRARSNSAAYL